MTLVTDQGLRPFPVQKLFSRSLRAPRLPRLPGGRRLPPAEPRVYPGPRCEAAALRPRDGGADFLLPAPGARPAPRSCRGSPQTSPAVGAAPTRSPQLPPSWARAFGCGRGDPARVHWEEPLAHRYLHPRRPPPPAPFLTKRPCSSFAWLPRRRLRTWREVGVPGFRNDAALAGRASGRGPRGARLTPGSGAAEPSPRPGKPSRSGRRPEPSAQGYHSPAEGSQATEHAQCETRLTAE